MKSLTQGQRKTIYFLATLICLTALCWFGRMDGTIAATNIIMALGIAVGGNAIEHMAKRGQAA